MALSFRDAARAADPESSDEFGTRIWIPGSLAIARNRAAGSRPGMTVWFSAMPSPPRGATASEFFGVMSLSSSALWACPIRANKKLRGRERRKAQTVFVRLCEGGGHRARSSLRSSRKQEPARSPSGAPSRHFPVPTARSGTPELRRRLRRRLPGRTCELLACRS
jgi:hypothetical protein